MIFTETHLPGAYVVDLHEISDDRGFFARAFCANEFEKHGLKPAIAQINLSFNERKGTMRGLHYQQAPAREAKFMRCITGAIYDVIVDMRPDSATYLQHFGIELSAENRRALYVPEMFAHGYLALTDGAQAYYSASEFYTPGVEQGLRYDDPALNIQWPQPVTIVSEKDAGWPLIQC
ncbi:dTDP-4-dehydrorhamnose 3,5-epimerase [Ruegeria arenilitoris]|uniref:dTDP-4-dehydrorhamnose 3,5-epimerase n=1 Tax=Ruegeria arenilitoris TaxID=1173585 RepID=UPI001480FB51|nr:dTDP-4-dehydrorhamnose 3,5-epimerase [Ruegeria arenilitoris]